MIKLKYPPDAENFFDVPSLVNYQISEDGRVWNKKTGKFSTHILLTCGYYGVRIHDPNYNNNKLIHRLLAETFIPNPNNYPCCNHEDGNKLNNVISNISWCTHKQNTQHAIAMGLFVPRNNSGRVRKLSDTTILELQRKWLTGAFSRQQLASEYNVSLKTVDRMKKLTITPTLSANVHV